MAKNKHIGTELNNVRETWEQNEKANTGSADRSGAENSDLQKVIKEEAAEYDNSNKEERVLGGDRASVRDDEDGR